MDQNPPLGQAQPGEAVERKFPQTTEMTFVVAVVLHPDPNKGNKPEILDWILIIHALVEIVSGICSWF